MNYLFNQQFNLFGRQEYCYNMTEESLSAVVHNLINKLEKLYYEPPPHPMLEKCYICETADTYLPKWAPQLGWENLIDHYQG